MKFTYDCPPLPAGWTGGFEKSNPNFAYPNPDLSSLTMTGNLQHIAWLKRQQNVRWPEFSWLTQLGNEDSRCYQLFSPFISRIGYTNTGEVFSIICPQQGVWIKDEVCLNVEVTVTGVRGWVNENDRTLAADMTVEPKIWLTPSEEQGNPLKYAWPALQLLHPDLPLTKEKAIRLRTFKHGHPEQPIFPLDKGETQNFPIPEFAKHYDDPRAWTVGNLEIEIGNHYKTHNKLVDDFNDLLMDAFNLASGNMLSPGNTLAWNVWFTQPQLVNTKEWKNHASVWRHSIDAHHGPPYTPQEKQEWPHLMDPRPVRHFDGTPFESNAQELEKWLMRFYQWIKNHI